MIVFRGELSEKNKKILAKKSSHIDFIIALIVSLAMSVPITVFVVLDNPIWALFYIALAIPPLGTAVQSHKKDENIFCPTEISIDEEMVIINGDEFYQEREIYYLNKIVDCGDCYRMYFLFPKKTSSCLCQKDLIVEGTIEEFEERFSEYIVRKVKNN